MELRVNYTWDESINIEYPNIHIHDENCIGHEQINDTYHYVVENNCGYEKEEEPELTDEEKYAKVYDEIYNGNAYYDAEMTISESGSSMSINMTLAGYYIKSTAFL